MNEPLLLNKHRENSEEMNRLAIEETEKVYGGHCPPSLTRTTTCGTGHVTPNYDGCQHGGDSDD